MLDENSIIPLYYQLKELLKEQIRDGTLKEGDQLPTERDLMEIYHISRATARKALGDLMNEGLIFRKQGVGTFVSKPKLSQDLIAEMSFVRQAIKQGLRPSSRIILKAIEKNTSQSILNTLNLKASAEILMYSVVVYINKEPIAIETVYIPLKAAPGILEKELDKTNIFDFLQNECKLNLSHSIVEIEPILINEFEAEHLDTSIGKPALSVNRVFYAGETPTIIHKRILRGERFKYYFKLEQNNFNFHFKQTSHQT